MVSASQYLVVSASQERKYLVVSASQERISWSLPAKTGSISWSLLAKGGSRLLTSWSRPAKRLNETEATLRMDTGMDFLSPINIHVRVNTGLNRSLIDRSQQPFEMSRPSETPHPF